MKIAVCIKWVPVVARMKFDTETKRIVREGVPSEVNGYDLLSVQRAIEIREAHGGEVTCYTMGPPAARDGLARCLAQGADRAFHLLDVAFAGSDTLATSHALALALGREQYDLILFGNFSVDAETGQVGPEVAELMGLPQVTTVAKVDVLDASTLRVERTMDEGTQVVDVVLPAVLAVTDGVAEESYPGRDAILAGQEREIPVLTAAELTDDLSQFGPEGSPTWVSEIRILEATRQLHIIEEVPVAEAAEQVVALLKERGALDPSVRDAGRELVQADAAPRPAGPQAVWVFAELGPDGVRQVARELLGGAQPIAEAIGGPVVAVVMGGPGVAAHAEELASHGADLVLIAESDGLVHYSTDAFAATLTGAIERDHPYAVLLPSTPDGRDLAARVAARLGLGLTGDCVGLEVDNEGRLVQLKPAFGGNVLAPIFSTTLPNMATVRPGILAALAPNPSRPTLTASIDAVVPEGSRVRYVELRPAPIHDVADLDAAWAIIGVGNGVGGVENLTELEALRQLLSAEYVTTRDVADAGWMPRQLQVGLTGRSVAPAFYLGVGVRGDFNHVVGLQGAGTLVCVNNNKRASIFRGGVDVAVLADWHEFVPALLEALRPELE